MYEEELRARLESLKSVIADHSSDPTGALAMLISETVRFRDRLKRDRGLRLTVGDTRAALDALENYIKGQALPDILTAEQKLLLETWQRRLTEFGGGNKIEPDR